ncbi:integrase catalytic domain-containing protein [Trichonephila clavipes]|nr:integrase catalytic domain-containing protein [Trichonephila clavipes]
MRLNENYTFEGAADRCGQDLASFRCVSVYRMSRYGVPKSFRWGRKAGKSRALSYNNCVTGVNSFAQQEEFLLRSKEILSRGCFNLRNLESNVKSKRISKSTGTRKLLAIIWALDKDTLKCKIDFESLSGETKITKRLILATVQNFFDPIGGRRTVRKIWNACVKCRKFKSKSPMTDPISLPSDRVKDAVVFEVVGADLAGPLYVKRGDKVWIVLYTCAIYRALQLELISSLSTDAFLLSFGRFVARRERLRIIYSDNGTNFRGAYNELIDIYWNEVSRYAEIQRITWKFIPPTAAWWGGFWESLVRTVKELLRRTLEKAIFTYEELLTILCECEKIVHSRPLTYLTEDMQDLTPITPARFLFEIPTADAKDLDFRDANHFRKRLRFRAKSSNIQMGDIVLIGDKWKKRFQWPLARVIKLIPGKDGLVRTVKLKTQSCTLICPIQHVFPLEVSGNHITNPPLQKVQQIYSSMNCPNPDTLKATEQPHVTRCGRPVKKPDKLNLFDFN